MTRVNDYSSVDYGYELEHFGVTRVDDPIDRGVRKRAAKRSSRRDGMNDVAKSAKPDDQKCPQDQSELPLDRIRASRSRVEWSFGSPTMATRPP